MFPLVLTESDIFCAQGLVCYFLDQGFYVFDYVLKVQFIIDWICHYKLSGLFAKFSLNHFGLNWWFKVACVHHKHILFLFNVVSHLKILFLLGVVIPSLQAFEQGLLAVHYMPQPFDHFHDFPYNDIGC